MGKYIPVKMPRGTKYGSNYWVTNSIKLNRRVSFYSDLEFKNYLTLEMDPNVIDFCEQPLAVELFIDDKKVRTVFDMWVQYKDGYEELQEVKPEQDLIGDSDTAKRSRQQTYRQKLYCQEKGLNYVIRTEKEIELGSVYIHNLSHLISRLKRCDFITLDKYKGDITILMQKHSSITIKHMLQIIYFSEDEILDIIAYYIFTGILKANLTSIPFSFDTEVSYYGE